MARGIMLAGLAVLVFGFALGGGAGRTPDQSGSIGPQLEVLIQELAAARARLEFVEGELVRLQQDLATRPAKSDDPQPAAETKRPVGLDTDALVGIEPPASWTDDEVARYVADILEVSSRTHHCRDTDPQIAMLVGVGAEYLTILLEQLGTVDGAADFHLDKAIKHLATDADRELILGYLPFHSRLASIVILRNWLEDAHEILIEGLSRDQYLFSDWFQAVTQLDDDRVPEALRRYMMFGGHPSCAYRALKTTAYAELDEAVLETWEALAVQPPHRRAEFAPIAAEHGIAEALEALARAVVSGFDTCRLKDQKRALKELFPYEGEVEELADLVLRYADRLEFDTEVKQYSIR